jgi:hypothetical protein
MPLLIELREYARFRSQGKIASFLEYLHSGASVRWHSDESQLEAWMKANPSLVLDLNFYYKPWGDDSRKVSAVRTRALGLVAMIWRDSRDTHAWLKARAQSDENRDLRRLETTDRIRIQRSRKAADQERIEKHSSPFGAPSENRIRRIGQNRTDEGANTWHFVSSCFRWVHGVVEAEDCEAACTRDQ